ncbi:MAG: hypothetical protein IJ092_03315 [Atopobiaceae bacterium]|nr:hypothetical protein [Atopobiaceae bacterium]
MELPEHERRAHREAFRKMSLAQKAEYIFAYYKLPLVLAFIALVAVGSVLHQRLTTKDALLYVGMANVSVNEEAERVLTSDYVEATGRNTRDQEVYLYRDLYLSDAEETLDHQYSYASRLKLLATIDAQQLDVIIMSRQSYDLLSHSDYLMDLSGVSGIPDTLIGRLESNDVIIEDNDLELKLGEAQSYEATTKQATNAIDISGLGPFQDFSDDVYLGFIGNTPRLDEALSYLEHITR